MIHQFSRRCVFGMAVVTVGGAVLSSDLYASDELADDLLPPVQLEANGEAIDVEVGHAAPFVGDIDGDGASDLLVGQFGGGKLRIYRNTGDNAEPKYETLDWFKAEHEFGTVPAS